MSHPSVMNLENLIRYLVDKVGSIELEDDLNDGYIAYCGTYQATGDKLYKILRALAKKVEDEEKAKQIELEKTQRKPLLRSTANAKA